MAGEAEALVAAQGGVEQALGGRLALGEAVDHRLRPRHRDDALAGGHDRPGEDVIGGDRLAVRYVAGEGEGGDIAVALLVGGRLLPPAQLAAMTTTVPADLVPGGRYGLGLLRVPLSCGGAYWGHGGDGLGYQTRGGVTGDGRAVSVVHTSSPSTRQQFTDTLAGVVGEWAQAPAGGVAWDLYGGVGLFAAVLAGQVGTDGRVAVVESAAQAVADGRAALADLPQVDWFTGRVEHVLPSLPAPPDVVVADPPRRGLGRSLVAALCDRAPGRVVHVACDPAALARDVALFAAHGYRLAALRAFDAFPMTHHMEATALLVPA